jgi:arylsulfatase A-like enzyme
MQAANAFRAEGATLKAIATYKKILKLDPSQYDVFRYLGDLNVERGLLSSAVQDYLTLGKHYIKAGKGKAALDIYKKIVSQDPSNLDAQQRVAELCLQENRQDEATTVYLQLGRERSAQQRHAEAKDAYQAVLRIDPANSEAAQFIDRNRDRPFFIYYALNTPHYPYQGDAKWLKHFQQLPYPRNLYAAFLAAQDERLGLLFAKLDESGPRERTIIVFQSDNGHSTEERAHFGGGSAGPGDLGGAGHV